MYTIDFDYYKHIPFLKKTTYLWRAELVSRGFTVPYYIYKNTKRKRGRERGEENMILCLFVGSVESGGEERSGERVQSFCSCLLREHTEFLYESGDHKLIILLPLPQSVSPTL